MRGDTPSAPLPNTGTTRRFSVRVLDEHEAEGQLFGQGWIDNQAGRRFVFNGDER